MLDDAGGPVLRPADEAAAVGQQREAEHVVCVVREGAHDGAGSSSSDWDDPEERADWSGQTRRMLFPPTFPQTGLNLDRDSFYFYVRQIDSDTPVSSAECSHSAFASAAS